MELDVGVVAITSELHVCVWSRQCQSDGRGEFCLYAASAARARGEEGKGPRLTHTEEVVARLWCHVGVQLDRTRTTFIRERGERDLVNDPPSKKKMRAARRKQKKKKNKKNTLAPRN